MDFFEDFRKPSLNGSAENVEKLTPKTFIKQHLDT